jgi:hypothetical protein
MQLPSYLHRVRGALRRTESRCRSNSCRRFRQPSRSAKTRSPTSAVYRAPDQIIQPVKPAYSSCVTTSRDGVLRKSSRPISGFRSLCGREQHSSSYCAQFDLRFGTFHSVGSRFENSGLYPLIATGPATLDRCCERNVVAPGQYSKWFFCVPIGLYRADLWPATARGIPARSAFGVGAGVNPAFAIKAWIWPL